jgi:hypothetical protein
MDAEINKVIDQYYNYDRPLVTDIQILDESLDAGILCIRWREGKGTVTVKSITTDVETIITELK